MIDFNNSTIQAKYISYRNLCRRMRQLKLSDAEYKIWLYIAKRSAHPKNLARDLGFEMTDELYQKLMDANLTAKEWRLWFFLKEIDTTTRWMPDLASFKKECSLSKSAFENALLKLEDCGLIPSWALAKAQKIRNLSKH